MSGSESDDANKLVSINEEISNRGIANSVERFDGDSLPGSNA